MAHFEANANYAVFALARRDLPTLLDALNAYPELATRDDACVEVLRRQRMPLLAAAIRYTVMNLGCMPLLDEVATRYARAHPRGTPMRLQFVDNDGQEFTHTPLSYACAFDTERSMEVRMRLLDHGLTDPATLNPEREGSVLRQALSQGRVGFITRLLREGFRFAPGEENERAVAQCVDLNTPERAERCLRTLLPLYAGRIVFANPARVLQPLEIFTVFPHALENVYRLVDVLRALGMRLTPEARAMLAQHYPGLLERVDAADAERVQRTVGVRRLLTRTIGVPEGEIGDAIASWASEGAPYSQRLVVVPQAVRLRHQQPPLTPPDAI